MARHYQEHIDIYQALTGKGRRKENFTTAQLRDELGFEQGSAEAQIMHNLVVSLKKAGVVTPDASGRKRNQYLSVVPDKRRELEDRYARAQRLSGNGSAEKRTNGQRTLPSTPRIVRALEQRVEDLEAQIKDLEPLSALADDLAAVPGKLDLLASDVEKLIDIWS